MDVNKINGTQFCKNCRSCDMGNHGRCRDPRAKQVWATNQRNGCDYFDGKLAQVDWGKAVPAWGRPSTFSK